MKVLSFTIRKRSIEIVWRADGQKHVTMLYRHSDYSWHPDADSAKLLPKTREELQGAVIALLSRTVSRAEKPRKRRNVWRFEDASPIS